MRVQLVVCDGLPTSSRCHPAFAPWQLGEIPAEPPHPELRKKPLWRIDGWNHFHRIAMCHFRRLHLLTPHTMPASDEKQLSIVQPDGFYQLPVVSVQLVLKKLLRLLLSLLHFTVPTKREWVRSGAARNSGPAPFPDGPPTCCSNL